MQCFPVSVTTSCCNFAPGQNKRPFLPSSSSFSLLSCNLETANRISCNANNKSDVSLSDIIPFEGPPGNRDREIRQPQHPPKKLTFSSGRNTSISGSSPAPPDDASFPPAPSVPQWALGPSTTSGAEAGGPTGGDGVRDGWGLSFRMGPALQRASAPAASAQQQHVLLLERENASLDLPRQDDVSTEGNTVAFELPPFQSVVEMTSAVRPPVRSDLQVEQQAEVVSSVAIDRNLPSGASEQLPDGSTYECEKGEDFGPNGRWCRWTVLKGKTAEGQVSWMEKWWEVSDWTGTRELGAEKSGTSLDGGAWKEMWKEALVFDENSSEPLVERIAEKWAKAADCTEWEEKWGEKYWSTGHTEKYAEKWAKAELAVWHERWGETYDGQGGCNKWTDKWAERLTETGEVCDKWGDKWDEAFKWGKGKKSGETWSAGGGGEYNRYWSEEHFGEGWVRKSGHSTGGEEWDTTEQSGTHYNPVPHFNYKMAMEHSPQLLNLPVLPRDWDGTSGLKAGVSEL